jgi:DNA-binding transcriptional ArsR family regulator
MIERLEISDPRSAALLANTRQRHILLALVDRERSQTELSETLGIALNLLHHHLVRLEAAELIEVTRTEPRRGRAVRYFRSVARSFFVPAEQAPEPPRHQLMNELDQALAARRAGTYRGILYFHDDGPRMQVISESGRKQPAAELWHRMRLAEGDAVELIDELRNLFARFQARSAEKGHEFIVHGAVARIVKR